MANLRIDPATSALILIDLQRGIVNREGAVPRSGADVVKNAAQLLQKFRACEAATVLVHVNSSGDGRDMLKPAVDQPLNPKGQERPKDWAEFVPEVAPNERDLVIVKRQWGAFYGTELDLQLRRRGVRTIVLAGIATNFGVESTARAAYERGYEQLFVEDAMTSYNAEAHRVAIAQIFPRMGRVTDTAAVLAALGHS